MCLFINQGSGSVNRIKIFQRQIKLMKKFPIVLCLVLKGKESWENKKIRALYLGDTDQGKVLILNNGIVHNISSEVA